MSYEYKQRDCQVVVCDICQKFSWIGDSRWRAMPQSTVARPIHICVNCRPSAVWCESHKQYHRESDFHRQPCVDCGGLYTSIVNKNILRCPACQRAAGVPESQPLLYAPPERSFLQRLFSSGHN